MWTEISTDQPAAWVYGNNAQTVSWALISNDQPLGWAEIDTE